MREGDGDGENEEDDEQKPVGAVGEGFGQGEAEAADGEESEGGGPTGLGADGSFWSGGCWWVHEIRFCCENTLPRSMRALTDSFAIIWLTLKCLPISRKHTKR